jgi:uncharacterized membrane protein
MLYTTLKFIHVVSIAVWFGGLVTMLTLNRILQRSGDPAAMQALGRQGGAVSMRLFMPAVLITVLTGIGMVQAGDLSFSSTWVVWGIIGTVVSFILGGIFTGAAARKLGGQLARGEIDATGAAVVQRRILVAALLNMLLLLSIVWAMVAKPA